MTKIRFWCFGAAATVLLASGLATAPASAAVIHNQHFHDSGSEPFTFCDGIDATVSWDDSVHELVKTVRSDQLVYFSANVQGTAVYTNNATEKTYTNVYTFTDRDQEIVDNGDGTLTITISNKGMDRWYGPDGKLLFVAAGNFAFQITVDHGGTPTDPEDDVEIEGSFTELKAVGVDMTAGRDFCEDLLLFTS
jgi:hypothetical protein